MHVICFWLLSVKHIDGETTPGHYQNEKKVSYTGKTKKKEKNKKTKKKVRTVKNRSLIEKVGKLLCVEGSTGNQ